MWLRKEMEEVVEKGDGGGGSGGGDGGGGDGWRRWMEEVVGEEVGSPWRGWAVVVCV